MSSVACPVILVYFLHLSPIKIMRWSQDILPVISDVGAVHSGFVYCKWTSLPKVAFWAFTKKEAYLGFSV